MAYLIAERAAIKELTTTGLASKQGGAVLRGLMEYMDTLDGDWTEDGDYAAQVAQEFGVDTGGKKLFRSPKFEPVDLPLDELPKTFKILNDLGLVFEIVQYPAFVLLKQNKYADPVPAYLPNNRVVIDPILNLDRAARWDEWKDATHEHLTHAGDVHIPLNSHTGGQDLAGSRLIQLVAANHDVRTMDQWPVIDGGAP